MSNSLTDLPGIGPATAETLKKAGFKSVDDLANADLSAVVAVPGFKEARAKQIIEASKALAKPGDTPAAGTEDEKPKKKKGKGKGKKKDKGKKDKGKDKKKKKKK